jgi:MEDS: MEthanogen/methylotroph, DcmR Sensory domain
MGIGHTLETGSPRRVRTTKLGGYELPRHSHVCAFFSSADEEYDVLLPFIRDGFDVGAKAFHTVDPSRTADHICRLSSADIDVEGCRQNGQLDLRSWNDVHLQGGTFEPTATASLFAQAMLDSQEQGFTHTRFVSHMGWAAKEAAVAHRLLEYEARANETRKWHQSSLVVCVYDLSIFSAEFVIDVMRTHPMVLVGGTLYENPFFVTPGKFVRELGQRASSREESPGH